MTGTRVEFKPGVLLPALVFDVDRAPLWRVVHVAALEAPELVGDVMVITDVWRKPSAGGYHPKGFAFDVRTGIGGDRRRPGTVVGRTRADRMRIAAKWVDAVRRRAGSEFDLVFGDAAHVDHWHCEHDQRKRRAARRSR